MKTVQCAGVAVWVCLSAAASSFAQFRYVDDDSADPQSPYDNWSHAATNIPEAVNVATSGDTVVVAPGVYKIGSPPLYIPNGKKIKLLSTNREAIIDAQGLGPAVRIGDSNAVIEGFTIENGYSSMIYGGGVQLMERASVQDCLIRNNRAIYGGGVGFLAPGGELRNCTITGNTADDRGGGIYMGQSGTCVVENCEITDNTAEHYGGGLYFQPGGIVNGCRVAGNQAVTNGGGGGYLNGGTVVNSVIFGNQATTYGGGLYVAGPTCQVESCTIVDNTGGISGGGVEMAGTAGQLRNSILFHNHAPTNANLYLHSSATSSYCCVSPSPGGSNFELPPEFEDLAGRNFRLKPNSPCIDTGTMTHMPETDYEGRPRPADGDLDSLALPDVGAFEHRFGIRTWMFRGTNSPECELSYPTRPGKQYVVEESATLFPTQNWVFVTTNRSEDFGVVTQAVPQVHPNSSIYRVTATSTPP